MIARRQLALVSSAAAPIEFHSLSPPCDHSALIPGPAMPQLPDGFAVPSGRGEIGMLLSEVDQFRGSSALRGIFKVDDAWLATNDLFWRDSDGDYWMVDLNDDREAFWMYDSEAGGRIVPADFASWAEYMAAVRRDLQEPRKWRG